MLYKRISSASAFMTGCRAYFLWPKEENSASSF
nr:MAG TPA: hypothetical protein [Microviridae sp.]